jgi:hypothetical protein
MGILHNPLPFCLDRLETRMIFGSFSGLSLLRFIASAVTRGENARTPTQPHKLGMGPRKQG